MQQQRYIQYIPRAHNGGNELYNNTRTTAAFEPVLEVWLMLHLIKMNAIGSELHGGIVWG